MAIAFWSQKPDMQVLFANLAPDDAAAIVEKLKESKVPYELEQGGATILVPSSQVHALRLELAGQGLPHGGGVGFELFDRTTVGLSDFVQKLNYRRALQGELARTIAQLPEVERARVHLALPERRLFSTEREEPRASVVVSLRRGQTLSKAQTQGIVHLVASSVEGLKPEHVTVLDGHGRLLSEPPDEGPTRLTNSQLDYQRALERDLETRIQSMLERVVGPNKAVVRVASTLDFRQVELTEERFDPNGQVVRSEQRSQEQTSGTNTVSGGPPGVQSNLPTELQAQPAVTLPSSTSTTQNKTETINYEISRTVSRIVEPAGTIKRLSVAVLVDGTYEPVKAGEGAQGSRRYVPRSEAEMKHLEEIVKKAMGYSAERQDQVEVVNVPFEAGVEEDVGVTDESQSAWRTAVTPFVRYGVGAVLAALILIFVVRPLIKALTTERPVVLPQGSTASSQPMTVGQLEAALGGAPALPQGPSQAQIVELARKNPQSTALVVKQWLNSQAEGAR
jgi:flagellar M-ring protein FliF